MQSYTTLFNSLQIDIPQISNKVPDKDQHAFIEPRKISDWEFGDHATNVYFFLSVRYELILFRLLDSRRICIAVNTHAWYTQRTDVILEIRFYVGIHQSPKTKPTGFVDDFNVPHILRKCQAGNNIVIAICSCPRLYHMIVGNKAVGDSLTIGHWEYTFETECWLWLCRLHSCYGPRLSFKMSKCSNAY